MTIKNFFSGAALAFLFTGIASAQMTSTFENKPKVPQAPSQKAVLLSDGQILGVYHAINQLEIQAAQLAQKKMSNLRTDGAQLTSLQTERDHKNLEQALENIQKQSRINPEDSELQASLRKEGQKRISQLEKLEGDKFAQEYLRHQVGFQTKAMGVFSEQLIPNAKNPQLKAVAQEGLEIIMSHFQQAGLNLNMKSEKSGGSQ